MLYVKSIVVIEFVVVIGVSKMGIEYGVEDGLLLKFFFMIVLLDGGLNYYIEVFVEFFFKLIEDGFIE